jgi:hypothetical protein
MKLEDLFEVKNGLASSAVEVLRAPVGDVVPYIRPASTQQRTIAGWVAKNSVVANHLYPAGTIFVSTDGEGSHTYSYVSKFDFVPNSNVSVLLPKREMALNEKVYYARCITMNRYKFSYGRKPKGDRLKQIELPDTVPAWVLEGSLAVEPPSLKRLAEMSVQGTAAANTGSHSLVPISELFEVCYGTNHELNALELDPHGVNFVSRSAKNNGVSAKVKLLPDAAPIPGGVLTVAGGGSVLETFLQTEPFYSGRDLFYLAPKKPMSAEELLFYAHCIKSNRFRYSYGRQANRTLKDIEVPARNALPAWVFGSLARVAEQVRVGLSA